MDAIGSRNSGWRVKCAGCAMPRYCKHHIWIACCDFIIKTGLWWHSWSIPWLDWTFPYWWKFPRHQLLVHGWLCRSWLLLSGDSYASSCYESSFQRPSHYFAW
jgi:hypothetical protein